MHWFGNLGKLSTKVIDNSGKLPVTLGLWAVIRKLGKWYSITLGLCGITLRVMPYGTTASNRGKGLELWLWLVHNPEVTGHNLKVTGITLGLRVLDEYYLKMIFINFSITPSHPTHIPIITTPINKIIHIHIQSFINQALPLYPIDGNTVGDIVGGFDPL